MIMSIWCLVQLKWTYCYHLTIFNLAFLSLHSFQLQCMLKSCSSVHSSSVPCHIQILCVPKPAPSILSYAMWLDPFLLLYLPGVKFTDTSPSPESMFYFHFVTTFVNCLLIMPC